MKITKVLEKGNCGSASDRGKEACIKAVSPRTETAYKAGFPGEVAQHTKARSLGGKVNAGIVQQEFTFLSGEIPFMGITMNEKSAEVIVGEGSRRVSATVGNAPRETGVRRTPLKDETCEAHDPTAGQSR